MTKLMQVAFAPFINLVCNFYSSIYRFKFLSMLSQLCDKRDEIMADSLLTFEEKRSQVNELMIDYNGTKCKVHDLG